ncbi:hypothetical protein DB30_07233 [Enhygromyxa salina]|uniref:Regulator of chromosome condensation (RCC1) repeat protein n=1 Tax=Enhygromyxa salina TaxID=215803 RepID=A0A0C2DGU9_9BACT|nr:hypothetical protein DB30_07233 [Enhygromyxa salina]
MGNFAVVARHGRWVWGKNRHGRVTRGAAGERESARSGGVEDGSGAEFDVVVLLDHRGEGGFVGGRAASALAQGRFLGRSRRSSVGSEVI